jgi:hypothetical protein
MCDEDVQRPRYRCHATAMVLTIRGSASGESYCLRDIETFGSRLSAAAYMKVEDPSGGNGGFCACAGEAT